MSRGGPASCVPAADTTKNAPANSVMRVMLRASLVSLVSVSPVDFENEAQKSNGGTRPELQKRQQNTACGGNIKEQIFDEPGKRDKLANSCAETEVCCRAGKWCGLRRGGGMQRDQSDFRRAVHANGSADGAQAGVGVERE